MKDKFNACQSKQPQETTQNYWDLLDIMRIEYKILTAENRPIEHLMKALLDEMNIMRAHKGFSRRCDEKIKQGGFPLEPFIHG